MTQILVIEDEASLREEIMEWLGYEGYEPLGAADGVEGVNEAFRTVPDLIVCDVSMPRLDGYQVLIDIRANSTLRFTPFVFLTAKADKEDIRKGMRLGADDYLVKPFDQQDLIQAIQTSLDKKAAREIEEERRIDSFKQALNMEHQQRELQAQMVAMFVHDFRNQLTVIMGSASLLRSYSDRLTEERRAGNLRAIEESSRQLLELIENMLSVAQMESGQFTLRLEQLDVSQLLSDIVQGFEIMPDETHQFEFTSTLTETVLNDSLLIRQIAANLISNAIKYSPKGGEIQITLDKRDNTYVLAVKDCGIGIPEVDLKRLFKTFQRGSNVGQIQGTGLGLAIVTQATNLLSGSIDVDSQLGVGTTFTVTLPLLTKIPKND